METSYQVPPFLSIYSQQKTISTFHISNITKSIDYSIIKSSVSGRACNLPFEFLKIENVVVPKEWTFSKEEEEFLQQLRIENCESLSIEKRTISQTECQEWLEQRKQRITSSKNEKKSVTVNFLFYCFHKPEEELSQSVNRYLTKFG